MQHSFAIILSPLKYLRVTHPAKWHFDVIMPLCLALFTMIVMYWASPNSTMLDYKSPNQSFVAYVLELFQILVGFYIASLTAIATFAGPSNLDDIMDGDPPVLIKNGKEEKLTRRKFLAMLFGYLSYISVISYVFGVFVQMLIDDKLNIFKTNYLYSYTLSNVIVFPKFPIAIIATFIFIFMFYNIFISTLLGLYYLSDKIFDIKLKKRPN